MTSQYWKLPLNWQEILTETKWAANGLSLDVKGPPTLVAEPQTQEPGGKILVHLLNYDAARRPTIENVEVSVRIPKGKAVEGAALYSPDAASSSTLAHAMNGEWVALTIPRVRSYAIVKIDLR